jgi:hypothetical protein
MRSGEVPPLDGRVGRQVGVQHWCPKSSVILLGSIGVGVVSLGKWLNVSLTSRDWAMCHQLLPRVGGVHALSLGLCFVYAGLWVSKPLSDVLDY